MRKNITGPVIGIYVAMYIAIIVAQIVLLVGTNINFDDDDIMIRVNSITNLAWYGAMFVMYIFFFLTFWKSAFTQFKENKRKYFQLIGLGFVSLLVISLLVGVVYEFLGITDTSANQAQLDMLLNGAFFDKLSLVLFAVFFAPMVEEMVFRMAGFNLLLKIEGIKPWVIITITSFIFGLIHVLGAMDFEQIFYYAGLGAVLGFFYYKSKNILVPIAIHMLLNGFVTITMFLF